MSKLLFYCAFTLLTLAGYSKINFVEAEDIKTWEDLLVLAQTNQKPLFVYVKAFPCANCKAIEKTAFRNQELSAFVNQAFIAVQVPNYSKVGQALIGHYNITQAPQLLLINANEDVFYKHAGQIEPASLLVQLQNANQVAKRYPLWKTAFNAGRIKKLDWVNYLLVEQLNGRVDIHHRQVAAVSRTLHENDFKTATIQRFVMQLGYNPDGHIFQSLKENHALIEETKTFNWKAYFKASFDYSLTKAIDAQDSILLEDYLHQLGQLPTQCIIPNLKLKGRQLFLAELNLWRGYDSITTQYLRPMPKDSANAYQREALFLMENAPYQTPQNMAMRYLQQGLKKKETFELYYTLSLALIDEEEWNSAYKAAYNAKNLAANTTQSNMANRLLYFIDGGGYSY